MPDKRPVSFFSLRTQFENVGDALINRELVRLVANESDVEIDLSRCPPAFSKNIHIPNSHRVRRVSGPIELITQLVRYGLMGRERYFFLSPGGYVGDMRGWQYISGLLNTVLLLGLRILGVRICHVGVSYERIGRFQRSLLRLRNRLLYRHIVRDQTSLDYARSLGLRVDGKMPDLAFGAVGQLDLAAEPRRFIALSFRADQSTGLGDAIGRAVAELDRLVTAEIPFKIVCQVRRDRQFLRQLKEIVTRRQVVFVDVHAEVDGCFAVYDDCKFIVSNRLHALLMGTIRGCKPIALLSSAVNTKIVSALSTVGVNDSVVELGELAGPQVFGIIESEPESKINLHSQKVRLESVFYELFRGN